MTLLDPVCGMRLDAARVAARVEHDGVTYHFCSPRCLAQFARDPARFIDPASADAESGPASGPVSVRSTSPASGRRCPYCGEKTTVARTRGATVGRLQMHELEVIIRGEWRRRLGPGAYARRHPPELIRALLAYALEPARVGAAEQADRLVAKELARLREQELGPDAIWQEVSELSHAAWDVLSRSRAPFETIVRLMEHIDGKLLGALEAEPRPALEAPGAREPGPVAPGRFERQSAGRGS